MTVVGRLTSIGTFFAFDYDETLVTKFRIGSDGTAYSTEFDENTGSVLSGNTRMRNTSDGSLIVLDSINEVDPFGDMITNGLQLYLDPGISTSVTVTTGTGQSSFTSSGTYTFTVPPTITSISAVVVGGGGGGGAADTGNSRLATNTGGGGGGLAYGTISVTPGETLTVVVGAGGQGGIGDAANGSSGGTSSISRSGTTLLSGGGGTGGIYRNNGNGAGGASGGTSRTGGGSGGNGGSGSNNAGSTGGGGAGGYSGNGGDGGAFDSAGAAGAGGGGGGGGGFNGGSDTALAGGGGGVGILGSGSNGTGGTAGTGGGGGGGSSGTAGGGSTTGIGGTYGGGGGGKADGAGGDGTLTPNGASGQGGAVRIIWGTNRSYPSTNVADQATTNGYISLTDLSGNGRTGIGTSGVSYDSTIYGGVLLFDGVNGYGYVPGYKGVTGTGARTSVIWFRTTSSNVLVKLLSWGATTAAGNKWQLQSDSTNFKLELDASGGATEIGGSTTTNITDGQWHMIAATAPASGTINDVKLYVDGHLLTDVTYASGTTAINTSSNTDVSFGDSLVDAVKSNLHGEISQVLIYNRELSDYEIKVIHRTILNRF